MNNLQSESRPDRLYGTRTDGVYSISGIVHVIRNEAELPYVREGEILVAQRIDPAWKEQLTLAKAIIEDASASNSEAENIASHYDLPAAIAVTNAMELRSGDIVILHGDGEIERVSDKRAPDSPMRVSVPAAVNARTGHGVITSQNVVALNSVTPESDAQPESDTQENSDAQAKTKEKDDADNQNMACQPLNPPPLSNK